ncbi:UDP-2,3-diacylglucosamine diphosphatase [Umboniibacter marinipuniceus]|uniref:UDP-2,3-diacylglucosamine hydrolase n=1 Tax=Umboniibacter marinipuniceus TaxID=569599 RepID=A0A3M0A7Q2_9GAMM|nr:UDP-2,3-diacylglucosamine diphosphatase [Umboniibacter marinipuniceus]RMA81103.1 UDP-2,3-diacylglucosamine hydrolase [Umboniibacter marinipuniceus]
MQRIFISDLHLDGQDERYNALLVLLNELPAGCELYLLGDIFEAWVGDDDDATWLSQLAMHFSELKARDINVFFMHGNRDFLLGEQWANSAGLTLIHSPYLIEQDTGENWVLCHGDELCTDDEEYQAFRKLSRSDEWQQALLAKPLAERKAIALHLRQQSQQSNANKADNIMDVNSAAVEQLHLDTAAQVIIHGHTHRPKIHDLGEFQRVVLGDWTDHYYYVVSDGSRFELLKRAI